MTAEQLRAANALARVDELSSRSEPFKKTYRSYVDRLSPTIVMNGLGQALAIECASAGPVPNTDEAQAHYELYQSLQHWLCRADGGVFSSHPDLLRAIMSHDETLYLSAQAEALAWLEWHKKFCRAKFPRGEDQ